MTTNAQHTPGPWTFYGDDLIAKNGELLAQILRGGRRQLPILSNRARIVACVNACEGINPEAVPKLLEACHQALFAIPTTHSAFATISAAIAKATL